jgi:hypothetical protein
VWDREARWYVLPNFLLHFFVFHKFENYGLLFYELG